MKDSEIVSKLIFLAFIAAQEPVQAVDDGTGMLAWADAMGLYARCVEREAHLLPDIEDFLIRPDSMQVMTQEEHKAAHEGLHVTCHVSPGTAAFAKDIVEKVEAEETDLSAAIAALEDPEAFLDPEPMKPGIVLDPPPIFPDKPNPLEETIPLRAKDINAELSTVPKFIGKGATEKRETFDRMNRFRETHRTQAFKVAAEASDGKLTEWQLRDMMEGKPAPMSRWNYLAAALDRLEVL